MFICGYKLVRRLKLFIVHYHLRPGGVRRVLEMAAPHLVRRLGGSIALVVGETPDAAWLRGFRRRVAPAKVEVFVDAALGYVEAGTSKGREERVRGALRSALGGEGIVWAHNLALGRNLFLARQLAALCAERGLRLVAHHHDWWCDHRWARWAELRRGGFRTLRAVAAAVFPTASVVTHVAINRADAAILRRHFPGRAHWLPNLVERGAGAPSIARRAPVWLMPCRVLRRKNIAEALLLTRWLRPEARLVITGGADETDELPYARALQAAAREHRWPVEFGAIPRGADVGGLLARCEAVVFTSIQEGFGLPALEAAAAGRPLIARRVPLVAADLDTFGFRFPQAYDEVLVDPALFDWRAEVRRQTALWRDWRSHLPHTVRTFAGTPILLASRRTPRPIPFSRLTLTAQLEVLSQPVEESWTQCAPLNPILPQWRERAAQAALKVSPWPARAEQWLSGAAYARRFAEIARATSDQTMTEPCAVAAQAEFIRARLDPAQMFPLLFSTRT